MADSNDPEVLALRKQTQALRDMVTSLQSADLDARRLAAESAQRALSDTFSLTSGTALRNPITGRKQDDDTLSATLLGRTLANTSNSASTRSSGASPYVTQADTNGATPPAPNPVRTTTTPTVRPPARSRPYSQQDY